jgi:hypothetical protein
MRAFEIKLNGKKVSVAGMEQGLLLFSIACSENRQGRGDIGLSMTVMAHNLETVRWEQRTLQLDDEVRIRIVEVDTVDNFEVLQPAPRDSRKYEKAYVRRMAKEFGWTIEKRRQKKSR